MENNQQRKATDGAKATEATPLNNEQGRNRVGGDNEAENNNRFAETADSNEQHSESSRPEAENETLGTP